MEHWRLCEKLLRDSVIPVKTLPPLLNNISKSYVLLYSEAHLMLIAFGKIGLSLQCGVMFTGLGGLLGSTPGLFVGIGLGNGTCFPLTWTTTLGGNSSEISTFVASAVSGKNLNCI